MRVLVTGASGFIGTYLTTKLRREGISFVALGNRCPDHLDSDRFIKADLLGDVDHFKVIEQAQCDHLIHLAWYTKQPDYWQSPLNLRWVEASLRIAEAFCNSGGKHMVIGGTCAEYDWSYAYCTENKTPLAPKSLYGVSKDAVRRLVMELCRSKGVTCAWGRIFFPYGMLGCRKQLVPSLIDFIRGEKAAFSVTLNDYRDFIHGDDVASAFHSLLVGGKEIVCNIGSGVPVSIAQLLELLEDISGKSLDEFRGMANKDTSEFPMVVSDNRLLKSLGWKQQFDLRTGLVDCLMNNGGSVPVR